MTTPSYPQLPLGLRLADSATFSNFVAGDNGEALFILQQGSEPFVYLWGAAGSGKSHLLQALCQQAEQGGASPAYLPLSEPGLTPEILEGLEAFSPLCLDDVQGVIGEPAWEQALFHLYNRVRDGGGQLVVTASQAPQGLGLGLPDLLSRLGWGPVFHLRPLDDLDRRRALQQRAAARGLVLDDDVGDYLLRRAPRDMHRLFSLLERLDQASLAAQRRLTIPFVRQFLN